MVFLLSLAACGAREAQPVAEQSELDNRLTCAHLQGEFQANQARLDELRQESGRRAVENVGVVLAFGLIPGGMAVDTGSTQRTEAESLQRRNARLQALMAERGCSG
jgi:hypothetical protein